jgi:hypothetical protein
VKVLVEYVQYTIDNALATLPSWLFYMLAGLLLAFLAYVQWAAWVR